MLKRRIIPIELLCGGRLVKTRAFASPRDVGDPVKSSMVYSEQNADELLLLNIDSDLRSFGQLVDVVKRIAENCFVPITVGGGLSKLEHVEMLFRAGADKILLNTAVYREPQLVTAISQNYGRQAVVVGVDVRIEQGIPVLFSDGGRSKENTELLKHIVDVAEAGAGEFMLQSIDRDGLMEGYDLELIRQVLAYCPLPVIVAGGAGNFLHLKEAFDTGVDAVACGSLFNFGDNNPLRAKAFLKNHDVPLKKL